MHIKKKKWFIGCISVVIIAVSSGYFVWNKPHVDIRTAAGIPISAIDLYNTFKYDSVKANGFLLNKMWLLLVTFPAYRLIKTTKK
ncbi:MAG: hypothetical protein M3139_01575 [Bacteroidota bacterium]|nr:hypothetical protein [Bacteroidota bacterium]